MLQRQNTSPGHSLATTPESGRRQQQQQQQQQHYQQHTQLQRRKSLTDSSSNGSSSRSASGSSINVNGNGSIKTERHHNGGEKPRKKLSFREPVVSEKERYRRRSSPLPALATTATMAPAHDANNGGNCADAVAVYDNRFACNYDDSNAMGESQAMRIVRTVGQAFEVCHKFNLHKNSLDNNDERSDISSELLEVEHITEPHMSDDDVAKKIAAAEQITVTSDAKQPQRPNHLELVPQANRNIRQKSPNLLPDDDKSPTNNANVNVNANAAAPTSPSREVNKLKDQLEQQALQTRQALAQLMLVREQLISETNARIEAQARTQQLLQQNRELLEHLASLGAYSEQQTAGLTSANIAMAPQSQLQMLLQATSNNNNLATINQQISNLGTINQQLTSLSHQLSGLNQQSQNLQNFQNISAANLQQTTQQQQQLTPPTSSNASPLQHIQMATSSSSSSANTLQSNSAYPSMNQLANISSQLQHINAHSTQQQHDALSKDLFQVNQELLNRLQALNLGAAASTSAAQLTLNGATLPSAAQQSSTSPHNSFFFVNPMSCSPSNNNNSASNFNFLSTPSSLGGGGGTLTPSPVGSLNRNSYASSPINDELQRSIEQNLNSLDAMLAHDASNGNIAAGGSSSTHASTSTRENSRSSSTIDSPTTPRSRSSNNNSSNEMPRFGTVMLKVTDESGNVTNQRKLSATPSFITRSTSEKVPNRSQMMSQVQRTAWARHTTK